MHIVLGSDHAGLHLKDLLGGHLTEGGHEVVDLGTHDESAVDYPDFAAAVGRAVVAGDADFGVCVCGTGMGIAIAANKIHGVRAAVVHDVTSARLAVEHNNANVVCFGAWLIGSVVATNALDAFLGSSFAGGRHIPRIEKITRLEESQ
ncbi:MAG TPA: ribose 5-phosphate isomerase B [Acidimicrobiales bacterium]|nr:ribose 5-phosphate isomerase B [Acidimicrobiales bacterium]